MDCIDLLTQQHREVNELFERIKVASETEKYTLFEQVAEALTIHTELEEQLFYPAVKFNDTQDLLKSSFEEHQEAKDLMEEILDSEPEDHIFDAKFNDLVTAIQHHVFEEESDLFPLVLQHLDGTQRNELGARMQEMTEKLQSEEEPVDRLYDETDRPAPL
jgi:hemerythrin superfamily protein